jgi:hypothetical protein
MCRKNLIIFILIATLSYPTFNLIKKLSFMHNLKQSLNGIVINLGEFGENESNYIVIDYTKNHILKETNFSDIFDASNGKILYSPKNKETEFTSLRSVLELDIKTDEKKIIIKDKMTFEAFYFENNIFLGTDKGVYLVDRENNIKLYENNYLNKFVSCNDYFYFITYNEINKKYEIVISTKDGKKLKYDEYIKTSNNKKYNIKKEYLNINKNFENNRFSISYYGLKNTDAFFTKDKKYKIYFKKKQGYWDERYLTLYVYAEEISTHKKLLLYKGTKAYYDEGMFGDEDFEIIKNNVYNWFIY